MGDLEALGRRAVACKHWRWRPGMLDTEGVRVVCVDEDGTPTEWASIYPGKALHSIVTGHGTPGWCADVWEARRPDLSDPATLGCLLALVRAAWGVPWLYLYTDGDSGIWSVRSTLDFRTNCEPEDQAFAGWGYSEAEALVSALEAAP